MIKVASPQINQEDINEVAKGLWSGRLTSGPMVAEFESQFAEYVGTKYAVTVNSGTAALHAALAGLGVQPGDEVVVPALTFFSTVTSVIHQGGVPVFCDISTDNFCLDPKDFKHRISPRTKAVIPVHYFGHCAEMDAVISIATKNDIKVIEDCAQAHGSEYRGKIVGSIGDCGAFSMFATKHMTTCEGGMVTTDSETVDAYIRKFRSHGLANRNDHVLLGYNYRMPEPLGALGASQLKRLDKLNEDRIQKSEKLISKITDIPWLTVPKVPDHIKHTYFWCHIWIDENELGMPTSELITKLSENGVEVRHRYVEPLYKQPLLNSELPNILKIVAGGNLPDYSALSLPNVEQVVGRILGLPNRPDMTDDEINKVADVLHGM
jgi:perosamine synthetase